MPIAGIYGYDGDPYEDDPEDLTFQRRAAFDTDRGVWLASSDGEYTREFDDEDLVDADIEEILDMFWARYEGTRGLYIQRESEVPGEIVDADPDFEPETSLIEGGDSSGGT